MIKESRKLVYKETRYFIFIFIFILLATLINPFGAQIHIDAFRYFGNPLLKDIVEYLPFTPYTSPWWSEVVTGLLVIVSIIILFFTGGLMYSLPMMGAAFILFIFSFEVRRYAWPAYYLIIPILVPLAVFLQPVNKRYRLYFSFILSVIFITLTIVLRWPINTSLTWASYCKSNNVACSPASAEYLRSHKLTKNLLSLYGWGGWLIWNYPDIKPGIDGRMHLWVDNKGYSGFKEYFDLEQNMVDVEKSKYDVAYMPPNKPIYDRLKQLVATGKWDLVYQDSKAGIFVRRK